MKGSYVRRLCRVVGSGDCVGWLCQAAMLGGSVVVSDSCVECLCQVDFVDL